MVGKVRQEEELIERALDMARKTGRENAEITVLTRPLPWPKELYDAFVEALMDSVHATYTEADLSQTMIVQLQRATYEGFRERLEELSGALPDQGGIH